jgi:hypothetical protein
MNYEDQVYCYDSLGKIEEITGKKILDYYWGIWYIKMIKKYGEGHYSITEQNCIDDWVAIQYAWKKGAKKTESIDKVFILEQVLEEIGALYEEETNLNRMNYLHHLKKNLEEIIDEIKSKG